MVLVLTIYVFIQIKRARIASIYVHLISTQVSEETLLNGRRELHPPQLPRITVQNPKAFSIAIPKLDLGPVLIRCLGMKQQHSDL